MSETPQASADRLAEAVRPLRRVGLEQLMALIDRTSAVIYMRDVEGRYMLVNRQYERLFGVTRDSILGLTDHDLFPPEIADEFRANDLAAIATGTPVRLEEIAPGDDGPHTYITVKFSLTDADGEAYAIAGISTDITERKRAEDEVLRLNAELERRVRERTAELEASTQELDAFAYSVSHDLRAPLRSLEGFSQILLEDHAGQLDEDGQGYLRRIRANATRMAQLIDDLLDLSRATRADLRRVRADVTQIAEEEIAELQQASPDRKADISIAPGLVVDGDPNLIRIVVQNLLTNAWKFTGRAEHPRITVDEPEPGVLRFADNGAGFDMRYQDKLFDPFQRLHTSSEFEGTGIGLAIVHRIMRRHGGRVWAHGEPGQGATFWVSFADGVRSGDGR
ncbi:sensor histidine kinase [Pilimelia columellifera]|uniref:Sensor-like histidine kinase SenX3 n=1 Tax=Pilimelia columellifera subsp. columellifera TaxID=706583 RepID=A0ABN3N8Y9_9ACTN